MSLSFETLPLSELADLPRDLIPQSLIRTYLDEYNKRLLELVDKGYLTQDSVWKLLDNKVSYLLHGTTDPAEIVRKYSQ